LLGYDRSREALVRAETLDQAAGLRGAAGLPAPDVEMPTAEPALTGAA
jgi:hypothetical protein